MVFRAHLDFLRTYGISGGIIAEPPQSAEALRTYLPVLTEADAKTLIVMPRAYYRRYWEGDSDSVGTGTTAALPVNQTIEGVSLLSPWFQGQGICFYESLPYNLKPLKPGCDILILINPEAFLAEAGVSEFIRLKEINARLRLGILADGEAILSSVSKELKNIFSVKGDMKELARYVFRNPSIPCPLPAAYKPESGEPPREFRKPSKPFAAGAYRFAVLRKFQGLNFPELKEEIDLFSCDGGTVPIPLPDETPPGPVFSRLTGEQRNYFFFWRGEFRRGRIRDTNTVYIYLYARELILAMGNRNPEPCFRELLALWQRYRTTRPALDSCFPGWLTGFAILYGITETALRETLPLAVHIQDPFFRDIALHKKYIESDTAPALADFLPLLTDKTRMLISDDEREGKLNLAKNTETALAAIESYLRSGPGKKFLEFFYPPTTVPVLVEPFTFFIDAGNSAYTAEWIRFSEHTPLKDFLETLVRYIEGQLRSRNDDAYSHRRSQKRRPQARPGGPPCEDPWRGGPWQGIVDAALGFGDGDATAFPPRVKPIRLEAKRLARLREESDVVRELLRIEEDGGRAAPGERTVDGETADTPGNSIDNSKTTHEYASTDNTATQKDQKTESLNGFLAGLGDAETAALRIIAEGGGAIRGRLEEFARQHHTMPDALIDRINEQFLKKAGDLLIDDTGDNPVLYGQYAGLLTGQ
ncbi:hypothetical protein FACS189493_4530 [Spirochaetia bacterium]|nr:hypothetical protein FACS189493_4530 [Spirochaetia bacterium]